MTGSWTQDVRFQAAPRSQAAFHKSQETFSDQEGNTETLQKNLETLFLTSNKLRQHSETTKKNMQQTIPRAEGALNQLNPKPK